MKRTALKASLAIIALATALSLFAADKDSHATHWGYTGKEAPDHWGALSNEFALCATGKHQSPVDLGTAIRPARVPVSFHYKETPLDIVNNGHTVQVNYAPGSWLEVEGKRYELAQFHFHSPSEHTVAGKHAPMEAHLVHRDSAGRLAVVGVLLKQGKPLAGLSEVWKHLPDHEEEQTIQGVSVNASGLLPGRLEAYSYDGSLTTPPCSEGVSWFVMADAVEVSSAQLEAFRTIISSNTRPVQPLNDRGTLNASR